jgi:hypothetical protein
LLKKSIPNILQLLKVEVSSEMIPLTRLNWLNANSAFYFYNMNFKKLSLVVLALIILGAITVYFKSKIVPQGISVETIQLNIFEVK